MHWIKVLYLSSSEIDRTMILHNIIIFSVGKMLTMQPMYYKRIILSLPSPISLTNDNAATLGKSTLDFSLSLVAFRLKHYLLLYSLIKIIFSNSSSDNKSIYCFFTFSTIFSRFLRMSGGIPSQNNLSSIPAMDF